MKKQKRITISIPKEVADLFNWSVKYDPQFKGNQAKVVAHYFTKGIEDSYKESLNTYVEQYVIPSTWNALPVSDEFLLSRLPTHTPIMLLSGTEKKSRSNRSKSVKVSRSNKTLSPGPFSYDASYYALEDGLIVALYYFHDQGLHPGTIFMDSASFNALVMNLGVIGKLIRISYKNKVRNAISFPAVYGSINILVDDSCSENMAYCHKKSQIFTPDFKATEADAIITLSTIRSIS